MKMNLLFLAFIISASNRDTVLKTDIETTTASHLHPRSAESEVDSSLDGVYITAAPQEHNADKTMTQSHHDLYTIIFTFVTMLKNNGC